MSKELIRHIFVKVVNRPDDPYYGIRESLSAPEHVISDVVLSDENYRLIYEVEYSKKRNFRFLYYGKVFRELEEKMLDAICADSGRETRRVVYFSDEGVWAEFLRFFKKKHSDIKFNSINIQHGIGYLERPRFKLMRRIVNDVATGILGYPAFGMGCYGGIGPGVFDVYLVYDDKTARFIEDYTGDKTIVCPYVIKKRLLDNYIAVKKKLVNLEPRILFAMQGNATEPKLKCDAGGCYNEMLPLVKHLVTQMGFVFAFRFHPGMNKNAERERFLSHPISNFAELDDDVDLSASLAKSLYVLSYDSTVLWEAWILGIVPVSVQCACYKNSLYYSCEILNDVTDFDGQVKKLFSENVRAKYVREREGDLDWDREVMPFLA